MSDDYTPSFYDIIRPGTVASAEVVVPIVSKLVKPRRVIDVGCGEGHWAKAFETLGGADVVGLDGEYVGSKVIDKFIAADLAATLPSHLTGFDLAVSLEVAEHLPESRARGFVADLCRLAPNVLFSAAIPSQGGVGHLNERWPEYWVAYFEQQGYSVSGALRWMIWDNDDVENWYRANLLFATRTPDDFPTLFNTPTAPPYAMIHPVLWDSRTAPTRENPS